ncbi:basigin isoform X2 [Prorops nasuta]|uniref:basigin isoform X2 n=1 Tax=Prorops nasuta TaxID=863751 RepID=UPI0034CDE9AD
MESRAAFVLLGVLYLAVTFVTVQAVTYSGAAVVHEGQAWSIECSGLKEDDPIRWTRNGQSLEPELSSGQLSVLSPRGSGTSKLSAVQATDSHDGSYKCTPQSNDDFHLTIYVDLKIKVLTPKDVPLILECENRVPLEKPVWLKEKVAVLTAFPQNEDLVKIDNATGNLIITKVLDPAYGNYTCKIGNTTTEYRVVQKPTVVLDDSTNVVEGEKLHLVCNGKQSPGIKVLWYFGEQNYTSSRGRVKISKDIDRGIHGGVLVVENIEMSDRGDIFCKVAYNWSDPSEEHSASAKTYLRVKDKYAALWPFLGICAEVVVLCVIILVYEKKRNKAELEESDTDNSPETKPLPNKDSDIRQRK